VRRFINDFESDFDRAYTREMASDYDTLSIQALLKKYDDLSVELLHKWKAPILSDTRCMIFFGLLKSLVEKWIPDGGSPSLYNDLLSGQGDLPSTEPTRLLMRIAKQVDESDAEIRDWFITAASSDINLELESRAPSIHAELRRFIDLYGFRCVNELKLESIDLHEDPSFAIEAIARFVRMNNTSVDAIIERAKAGGGELVGLMGTSAWYAPGAAAAQMAEAIALDQNRIFPCAVHLTGQYGIDDLFVGVPVKLGKGGVKQIIEVDLTADEQALLDNSADAVRGMMADLDRILSS
jgi:hypothetical protein